MYSTHSFAFTVAVVSLIGTPIFAPMVISLLFRKSRIIQRKVIVAIFSYLFISISVAFVGLSLQSYEANVVINGFTYFCFGIIVFSIYRLKPRALGITLGVIATIPIVLGVLMSTIGLLALVFIIGDSIPIYKSSTNGTTCYVYSFGNATTSNGGYNVEIKKQLTLLPFIEYTIRKERISVLGYSPPADACK